MGNVVRKLIELKLTNMMMKHLIKSNRKKNH